MIPRLRPGVTVVELDGEAIAYHDGHLHFLNVPAAAILRRCDGSRGARGCATAVASEFGVEVEDIELDVLTTIERLRADGLVEA